MVSFFEIYQETLIDLLNTESKHLNIREEQGDVFVENLIGVPVKNREQAMNIINAGLRARHMAG